MGLVPAPPSTFEGKVRLRICDNAVTAKVPAGAGCRHKFSERTRLMTKNNLFKKSCSRVPAGPPGDDLPAGQMRGLIHGTDFAVAVETGRGVVDPDRSSIWNSSTVSR